MNFNPDIFQENLKLYRKRKNYTQDQLAEKIELNSYNIGAYESGKSIPRVDILIKICVALDVSLDTLFFEKFNESVSSEKSLEKKYSQLTITRLEEEVSTQKKYIQLLEKNLADCESKSQIQ